MRSRLKPDNFYKFILADKINLRIPAKFIRDHRKNILLNDVLLSVSDSNVWLIGLMVSGDGNVWLSNGWEEFTDHYRLKTGHLLLFNHLGKSVFHVRIFDQTCCEIDYISPIKSHKSKMEIDRFITQDCQIMSMEVDTENQELEDLAGKQMTENRVFELAESFKSDKPFYSVTINGSYIKSWMYVPVAFMRRYLTNGYKKCVDCIVEVSNGRKWGPIMCIEYKTYGKMYGDNWKKFRDDNYLAVGDVCVFELIDEIEKVLRVNVFRDSWSDYRIVA